MMQQFSDSTIGSKGLGFLRGKETDKGEPHGRPRFQPECSSQDTKGHSGKCGGRPAVSVASENRTRVWEATVSRICGAQFQGRGRCPERERDPEICRSELKALAEYCACLKNKPMPG